MAAMSARRRMALRCQADSSGPVSKSIVTLIALSGYLDNIIQARYHGKLCVSTACVCGAWVDAQL